MDKVILDAYEKNNPVLDKEAAVHLSKKLSPILKEYADYMILDNLQNSHDYERHCDFFITAYTLILKEDKITAGNTLRYMLSQQ